MKISEIREQIRILKEQERIIIENIVKEALIKKKEEIEKKIEERKMNILVISKTKKRICEWCGNEFEFIFKQTHNNHCSHKCFKLAYNEKRKQKYSGVYHQKQEVIKKCKECGENFTTTNARKIFCCDKCRDVNKKEKTKIQPIVVICKECGKKYIGNRRTKYCSDNCAAIGYQKIQLFYKNIKDERK